MPGAGQARAHCSESGRRPDTTDTRQHSSELLFNQGFVRTLPLLQSHALPAHEARCKSASASLHSSFWKLQPVGFRRDRGVGIARARTLTALLHLLRRSIGSKPPAIGPAANALALHVADTNRLTLVRLFRSRPRRWRALPSKPRALILRVPRSRSAARRLEAKLQ